MLYLIEILHQTTTQRQNAYPNYELYLIEILHQTTTRSTVDRNAAALYLIEILHQTTTLAPVAYGPLRCILSKFYIKPQRTARHSSVDPVVSYRNSTSNHNERNALFISDALYLIEILHQTTTPRLSQLEPQLLYLIEILHQTTTFGESP